MSRFREYLFHLAQGLVIFSEIQALFLPRLYNKVSSSRCAPMYEKFRLLRQIGKYPIDFLLVRKIKTIRASRSQSHSSNVT